MSGTQEMLKIKILSWWCSATTLGLVKTSFLTEAEWLVGRDKQEDFAKSKFLTETEWLAEGGYSQTGSLTEDMLSKTS